jgi:hypothetical protein
MTRMLAYFFAFSLQRVIVASSKWKYTVRCAAVLAVFHVGDDDKLYRDESLGRRWRWLRHTQCVQGSLS